MSDVMTPTAIDAAIAELLRHDADKVLADAIGRQLLATRAGVGSLRAQLDALDGQVESALGLVAALQDRAEARARARVTAAELRGAEDADEARPPRVFGARFREPPAPAVAPLTDDAIAAMRAGRPGA